MIPHKSNLKFNVCLRYVKIFLVLSHTCYPYLSKINDQGSSIMQVLSIQKMKWNTFLS